MNYMEVNVEWEEVSSFLQIDQYAFLGKKYQAKVVPR